MIDTLIRFFLLIAGTASAYGIYDLSKGRQGVNIGLLLIAILAFILAAVFPTLKTLTAKIGIDGGEISFHKHELAVPKRDAKIEQSPNLKNIGLSLIKNGLIIIIVVILTILILSSTEESLAIKWGSWGPAINFKRYSTSESERKQIIELAQDTHKKPEITDEEKKLIENAKNRRDQERAPEDYLALSMDAWKNKKFDDVLKYTYFGLSLNPKDIQTKVIFLNRLGIIYAELGENELASKQFDEALKIDQSFSKTHYNLGVFYYYKLKNLINAEKEYKNAIDLRRDYAEAYNELGLVYNDMRKYAEAEKAYKEAIRLKPDFEMAHNNLALLQKEMGK